MSHKDIRIFELVIAAGASVSNAAPLEYYQAVGLSMPVGWTAAVITLRGHFNVRGTMFDLFDNAGLELTLTVGVNRIIAFSNAIRQSLSYLKSLRLRSGTAAVPVTQAEERKLELICERLI